MTVTAINAAPGLIGTRPLDDTDMPAGSEPMGENRGEAPAAVSASAAGVISTASLADVGLHKDVRQFAHSPRDPGPAGPPAGGVLYNGKEPANAAAATETSAVAEAKHKAARAVLIEAIREAVKAERLGSKPCPLKPELIELLHAFRVTHGASMMLLLNEVGPSLQELLGAYGYRTVDTVGSFKMEFERLDYAIENFRKLSERDRAFLEYGVKKPGEFGIRLSLTPDELRAREQEKITFTLPDGKKIFETRANCREAERRNINNHALAQLKQIRSAGPMSLVGRVFAGEKGAAVGAMFDSMVDAGAAQKANAQVRSGVATPSDASYRTPVEARAPASARAPAGEGRPDAPSMPAAPAAVRPPVIVRSDAAGASALPRTGDSQRNRSDAALADTQPRVNPNGANPGAQTGTGGNDTGLDAQRAKNGAQYRVKEAEIQARVEADAAHQQETAAKRANYERNVRPTLPAPNERLEMDRVIDGIRREGWAWHVNNDRATHEARWRAEGNTTTAPLAYRHGDYIYVDYKALTPAQERALDRALNEAALRR